jgi:hypothetical protein
MGSVPAARLSHLVGGEVKGVDLGLGQVVLLLPTLPFHLVDQLVKILPRAQLG